jgi:hypothetical protein
MAASHVQCKANHEVKLSNIADVVFFRLTLKRLAQRKANGMKHGS